jgi:hypothetical protein
MKKEPTNGAQEAAGQYHRTPTASQGNAFTQTYTGASIWDRAPAPAPAPVKRKAGRPVNTKLSDGVQQKTFSRAGK